MALPQQPHPEVAVIIKLGGAAITNKQQLESLNSQVLAAAAAQLAALHAAVGPRFVVVHGAGSFGHQAAAAAGVAGGGIYQSAAVRQGFAATRASVTKLNQLVVAALVDAGVPAVGVSPCPAWTTRQRQVATDGCGGVAALLSAGLVPVLHGDAVLDEELGCTILSGDVLVTRLCHAFRPPVVAFLVRLVFVRGGWQALAWALAVVLAMLAWGSGPCSCWFPCVPSRTVTPPPPALCRPTCLAFSTGRPVSLKRS